MSSCNIFTNYFSETFDLNRCFSSLGPATAAPITTLAGSGTSGLEHADGVGTLAIFSSIQGIAISSDGMFALVVDLDVHSVPFTTGTVRRLTMGTGIVTTLAGSDLPFDVGAGSMTDGIGTAASFSNPYGVSISPNASFALVTDDFSHRMRRIEITTGAVTTLAGSSQGYADGAGTAAMFSHPKGVAISPDGSFALVADSGNNCVRRIQIATGAVTTLAGLTQGYTDGVGTAAMFQEPYGVTISPDGSFALVADTYNHRVRRLAIATGVVTTLAGSGLGGPVDGTGVLASFGYPCDVAISPDASYALIVEMIGNRVRHITLRMASSVVTTLAGSDRSGYTDGVGTSAMFNKLSSVAIEPNGAYVLIADQGNRRIRRAALTSPCSAGFFCLAGSSSQSPCPLGSICPNASTTGAPRPCPIATYCPMTGMSTSLSCPSGSFCATSGLSAVTGVCDYGFYCPSGSTSAEGTLCLPGNFFQNQTVKPCGRGYFCAGGIFTPPTLCPAGTYCAAQGLSVSSQCDGGLFCGAVGLTAPSGKCDVGQVCPAGASAPAACPAGMLCQSAGMQEASACPAGSSCSAIVKTACESGFYALGNVSACSQCPRGSFSSSPGS
jgi:DNA-binding beta-propeller fold protein YncE